MLASGQTGRDYYDDLYKREGDREAEWLRRTSLVKADSVVHLLHGERVGSLLELGAGTGAVITELARRDAAEAYYAVDYSETAIEMLRASGAPVDAAVADITETPDPFGAGPYDVVYATHVVEHLEDPGAFLRAVRHVPHKRAVFEVPIEDLLFGKLKALRGGRAHHPAGHVQFFTPEAFRRLVTESEFRILRDRLYAPCFDADTLRFAYGESGLVRRMHKGLTERYLPRMTGPLWTRLWHAHYAVLAEPIG